MPPAANRWACAAAAALVATAALLAGRRGGGTERHNAEGAEGIEEVSADGQRVLRIVPLDLAHRSALVHRGVWVYATDGAGRLLMLRRPAHMRTCPGAWSIVGEHLQPGESYLAAARRGLAEELGWAPAAVGRMAHTELGPPLPFDYEYGDGRRDRQWSQLVHFDAACAPAVHPDPEEARGWRWVPIAQLRAEVARGAVGQFCSALMADSVIRLATERLCSLTSACNDSAPPRCR
eukprot:TRINITY_DN42981_c0_g1_i1.p1 TRINITY_DN42981_c0_g1~~TRINITY_DN42981_c0_g1_i1.p1  ORF type:complete len:235 (+),score=74.88 TRINITY_DN42981_c0_g1_i1:101-805(+)